MGKKALLWCMLALAGLLLDLVGAPPALAGNAVVGGACDEAAFDSALATVQGSGGGTITFNCGAAPFFILLSGQKTISSAVTINGGNWAVLSGQNATRLFVVNNGAALTLRNITIRNGYSAGGDGGAVYNSGTLTVRNSKFLYNTTAPSYSGGAIVSYGPLNILDNSEFAYNQGGGGGAVYPRWAGAPTTIADSQFHDNETTSSSSGWGGALLAWDGPLVSIENSRFFANRANEGGALFITSNSTLTTANSEFSGNVAQEFGGAINNWGTATIADSQIAGNNCWYQGGGLYNAGSAELNRVTVNNQFVVGHGGGIYSTGSLKVHDSTIHSNQLSSGGGGGLWVGGTTEIVNSTIVDNIVSYTAAFAGGIYAAEGSLTLQFTTIAGNVAQGLDYADADAILAVGSVTAKNTIVSSPAGTGTAACSGTVTSLGYNIDQDGSCWFSQPTDRQYVDPQLGPLADNGGPTLTALPAVSSPAVDHGACVTGIGTDQRGFPRPHGAACDIGAVERRAKELNIRGYLPLVLR